MINAQLKVALAVLLGLVVVLALTVCAYWVGLSGAFILDDGPNIVLPYISQPDWHGAIYAITHNGSGWLGRSISMLSFVLTGLQYGLDPWGYKFHNLMLHLLNGVLLFRLLHLLLPLLDRQLSNKNALLIAGSVAALWLLHPLLVSTVLYAVQRMTQLAVLFTLLALLAYLKARLSLDSRWRYLLFGGLVFPLCGLLAVLSKENGALLPFYLLVVEVFAFRTRPATLRGDWRIALPTLCYIVIPLILGLLVLLLKFDSITDYSNRTFTLSERLLTQLHVIFFYVRLILLPRISSMSLFQDDFPVQSTFDVATLLLLLALCALIVLIWKVRNLAPVLAFGLAWFLVSHLMESTIIALELVFEHRNYLAAVGLLLPVVHIVLRQQLVPRLDLVIPLVIVGFAFMTSTRASEWGNYELFSEIAMVEHPNSSRAQNNYINLMISRRDYEGAIAQLEKMREQHDDSGVSLHMLFLKCGVDIRDAAGLAAVQTQIASAPISVYAMNSLQSLVNSVVEGSCKLYSLDEMERLVTAALNYPMNQEHVQNHAYLLRLQGIVALAKGAYATGYALFMMAHEATQDVELLHELLGYQIDGGKLEDAQETLSMVERRNDLRFGVDTWRVRELRKELQTAQSASDDEQPEIKGDDH